MSVKTILVALNDVDSVERTIAIAAELGGRFDAHVIGMFIIPAIEIYPDIGMQMTALDYEGHRSSYLNEADGIKKKFEEEMRRQGVRNEWRIADIKSSRIADGIVEHAFQSDLVIVPQGLEKLLSRIEADFTAHIVMESGRPVLIIPAYGDFTKIGQQVLVAWNGTRESARSVFDALPLMKDAKNVTLSWLNAKDDLINGETLPGTEMAVTLARHNIKATAQSVPTGDLPTGEALLSHANDIGADLLVMGAYGHSRLREFVFGGATRTILDSMTIPVLMSH